MSGDAMNGLRCEPVSVALGGHEYLMWASCYRVGAPVTVWGRPLPCGSLHCTSPGGPVTGADCMPCHPVRADVPEAGPGLPLSV